MAGEYFDADAYLAAQAQNQAFTDAVLGANQNGVSPLAPYAPQPPAPPQADPITTALREAQARDAQRAEQFRAAVLPPVERRLPLAARTVPFVGGALGDAADAALPRRRDPISFTRDRSMPEPINGLQPMYEGTMPIEGLTRPEIQAAPTLAEQARKAVGGGNSLSMGGPSLGGLQADWRRAQQAQVETIGQGADLQRELGIDKAMAMQEMSGLRAQQAQRMQEDAERQMQIEADTDARHQAFISESLKLSDAVAAQNVDPLRFLHNADVKQQFLYGLGGALGGALSAINGGPNQFLDRLDALADRDFKGQLANLDNKRSALSARNTVYSQLVSQRQDRRLGDMQARDLMYTAMKTKLMADADRLGIPEVRTQAEIAANAITERQKGLQAQIAEQSYKSAQAAAQAAAAAQRAGEERAWQRQMDLIKLNQNQQEIDIKAGKEGPNSKEAGERKVVLDGKDMLAVNKTAAEKWNEYNHGREVFNLALQKLIKAREAGNVGEYDAARAQLIEEYPKLLGYTRAPTEGQISHTVGPNAIPEYNHWYDHAKYGPAGVATYQRDQGRAQEKIDFLDKTLATSDKSMRENTFGAAAGKPKMPDTVQVKK